MLPLLVAVAMVIAGELIYYSVSTFTYTLYSIAAAKLASKSATQAPTPFESSKPTTQKCDHGCGHSGPGCGHRKAKAFKR